ncbi:MAG: T9SS type A sorting domain-containing protein [Cyclonatronaceae bacterium]
MCVKTTCLKLKRYQIFSAFAVACFMFAAAVDVQSQAGQFEINNIGHAEPDYVVDRDADGYIIAIWTDMRDAWWFEDDLDQNSTGEEAAVYGRIFDPNLNPTSQDFRISGPSEDGTTALNIDLLVLDDGRFVALWVMVDPLPSGQQYTSVRMAMFNRNGEVLIAEQEINENKDVRLRSFPKISRIPDKRFMITWSENKDGLQHWYGQLFDNVNGFQIGGNFQINIPIGSRQFRHFYVNEDEYLGVYDFSVIQRFNTVHEPLNSPVNLNESLGLTGKSAWPIYIMGQDTLMVIKTNPFRDRYWFQLTNLEGEAYSDPVVITDNNPLQILGPIDIAINPDDKSFILIWEDRRNSLPAPLSFRVADIYAQRYDVFGNRIGTNFKVNHEPREKNQLSPFILYLNNGSFLATWWEFRNILCFEGPDLPINHPDLDAAYLTARILDFVDPNPGPVWGWESFVRERHRYCSNVSENRIIRNYPNPFYESTTIEIDLLVEEPISVKLEVFDIMGRLVRSYDADELTEGTWLWRINLPGQASGTYIARLTSPQLPGFQDTIKMLLIR